MIFFICYVVMIIYVPVVLRKDTHILRKTLNSLLHDVIASWCRLYLLVNVRTKSHNDVDVTPTACSHGCTKLVTALIYRPIFSSSLIVQVALRSITLIKQLNI